MGETTGDGPTAAVHDLADAGRAVAEAAGAVAGDRVRVEVAGRASRAAVEVKAFAVSMRASSSNLRDQGHVGQADLIDEVAARADRLAAHLATSETDDLVEDVKRLAQQVASFARKEPALVIAGAFTLGLLAPKAIAVVADHEGPE
jgi:hypothetical protein